MTDPLTFASASPRFAFPLLHAGQAQKEIFVNEALLLADALMHCCVRGEATTPPPAPVEGDTWIVGAGATARWAGHDHAIAVRRGNGWAFATPRDGMRAFDLAAGCERLFFGFWRKASTPVEPLGGTSVDGEARAAIKELVSALQALGILPSS